MGPLDQYILADDALTVAPDGCRLQIRSHWYRSLPLSSVGILTVQMDGVDIPADNITFELNERRHALSDLPSLHDEWWYILDAAALYIQTPMKFVAGTVHEVSVELGLLLPYILVGPNAEPLLSSSRVTKIFTL
jgi:Domain of unknown function (DUF6379)